MPNASDDDQVAKRLLPELEGNFVEALTLSPACRLTRRQVIVRLTGVLSSQRLALPS